MTMSGTRKRTLDEQSQEQDSPDKRQKTEQAVFWTHNPKDMAELGRIDHFSYVKSHQGHPLGSKKSVKALNTFLESFKSPSFYITNVACLGENEKGLIVGEDCPANTVIGYFVGEWVGARTDLSEKPYFYSCNSGRKQNFNIDATKYGNEFRYVNHSEHQWNIDTTLVMKGGLPAIEFTARRDLKKGEQVFLDYTDVFKFSKPIKFLNPSDNAQEANDIVSNNKSSYTHRVQFFDREEYQNTQIMCPHIVKLALNDEFDDLRNRLKEYPNDIHLPLLTMDTIENNSLAHVIPTFEFKPMSEQESVTTLMLVAAVGTTNAIKIFLEHGANVETQNTLIGITAIFYAATNKNQEESIKIIENLLEYGAALDVRNQDHQSILHWCILQDKIEALNAIINYTPSQSSKYTPGSYAEMLQSALAIKGHKKNETEEYDPILFALKENRMDMAELLLKQHDEINQLSFFKNTSKEFLNYLVQFFAGLPKEELMVTFDWMMKWKLNENIKAIELLLPILADHGYKLDCFSEKSNSKTKTITKKLVLTSSDGSTTEYMLKLTNKNQVSKTLTNMKNNKSLEEDVVAVLGWLGQEDTGLSQLSLFTSLTDDKHQNISAASPNLNRSKTSS